jgi:hypothetical protein
MIFQTAPVSEAGSSQAPRLAPVWRMMRKHSLELSLLLFLWFVCGIAINSRNLLAFNLQQAGVEAIVERRQFALDGSQVPQLQMRAYLDGDRPFGDVFLYNGKKYGAKQPGQFMAGALVYFFLHLFGLNYANNYLLTSALVTFFTTSLITAVAGVAVFRVVREFTGRDTVFWPLVSAVTYGLGTTAFVYSGIAHHDGLASGYLAVAFYLALRLAHGRTQGRSAKLVAGLAGFLLGLTVTTSLLPLLMAVVVSLYLISLRRWEIIVPVFIGGLAGIAPLLFYNAVSFGNPFLPSYIAGGYRESYVHLDLRNTAEKIAFYARQISLYIPVAWVGVLGWCIYPRAWRRERLVVLVMMIGLSIQILNMDSDGGCGFGPRFLLPAMPFACVGLGGFHYVRAKLPRLLAVAVTVLAAGVSIFVSFVGAIYGAMYCDMKLYGLWPGLEAVRGGAVKDTPLAIWLLIPLLISALLLAYSVRTHSRTPASAL